MSLIYTKVVPDLLFYTEKFVLGSTANKSRIDFSGTFNIDYLGENKSFIRLLFDENYDQTTYRYLYREELDKNSIPGNIFRRMKVYSSSKYYVCDSDSTSVCNINIFNLQPKDLEMLDNLLHYRIDSTSVNLIQIVYNSLNTRLSKLIYCYLNFKINSDYSIFDSPNPISESLDVLESFYEAFISDLIFVYLSNSNI